MKKIIVAIDGPASSGKSTTARGLAKKLGYIYIDTGAMYRACALLALQEKIDLTDYPAVCEMMGRIEIRIEFCAHGNKIFLNQNDVTGLIRQEQISRLASEISALACVREKMVDLQRKIGQAGAVVLDGRDIGTVVFPEAELKFFMVASVGERAKRRWLELQKKGEERSFSAVLADIIERDRNDSSRALAPLIPAVDAIHIDTTAMSIEQQIELLYDKCFKYIECK